MRWRAADRAEVGLAGTGFSVSDEFGHGLDREHRGDDNHTWAARHACYGHDVANEIEAELVEQRCVDRVRGINHKQRMAVSGCTNDRFGSQVACGARAVFDDVWLAEALREPLRREAGQHVCNATRGKPSDQSHRPRRISLRTGNMCCGRQRGGTRCEMKKKLSAGKFHEEPPGDRECHW
jgi:hypothetical protein